MQKITIELTDTEYKHIKENAEDWKQTLEDYIVIAAQLYVDMAKKKIKLQIERDNLEQEIIARNNCIDKYEDILQKYYEQYGDLKNK